MNRTFRRLALTCALSVVASGLAAPLVASPAGAVALSERVWTLTDTNADGTYGLAYTDTGGTRKMVEESGTVDYSDLSSSADGSRIAYLRETAAGVSVIVRDTSTRVVRTVASYPSTGSSYPYFPQLSPNGASVVWTQVTESTNGVTFVVRRSGVGSGTAATVVSGYVALGFVDAGTLLVQSLAGANKTVPLAGGTLTAVAGLSSAAYSTALSPTGTEIAWVQDVSNTASDVHVASIAKVSGTWTVSGASVLATGQANEEPTFSRDGQVVYFTKFDGTSGDGDVWSRPFDLSSGATQTAVAGDEMDVAVTAVPASDVTSPGPVTPLSVVLAGTQATVRWTLPADSDLSGVIVSRTGKTVYVPAPQTSYLDSGLSLRTTYTYSFTAVDRSGKLSTAATRNMTALAPAATFSDPTSTTSASVRFPVRFAASALSSTRFTVDYLLVGSTTWTRWVTNTPGLTRTFGAAATTGVNATPTTPGRTYRFRVLLTDAYGNSSAWAYSARTVVPYDQTRATLSGGNNVTSSAAYLGSVRRMWSSTHSMRISMTGNRLSVVGWKCAKCGKVRIYDNGTYVATVDTYRSATQARAVLYTRTYSTTGSHTFTLRPVGTSGRPYVLVDGFGMRR